MRIQTKTKNNLPKFRKWEVFYWSSVLYGTPAVSQSEVYHPSTNLTSANFVARGRQCFPQRAKFDGFFDEHFNTCTLSKIRYRTKF